MATESLRVLVLCRQDRRPHVEPLVASLARGSRLSPELTTDPGRLERLDAFAAVLVDSADLRLDGPPRDALRAFVEGGGAAIAAGDSLGGWDQAEALSGWTPDGRTVDTELVLRDAGGASLLGAELRLRCSVHLLSRAPDGAEPLLMTRWRHADHVVAYARNVARGRFVYLGLARETIYLDENVQRLVRETVVHACLPNGAQDVVGVGLLGFGALGRAHLETLRETAGLELRGVCDRDAARRTVAESLGASTVAGFDELLARPDIGLVVISTQPARHAEDALAALGAGKHVVCEKPFALNAHDCDRVIARAREADLTVTVFQNRRWDPDFVALREAVRGGAVGVPFYMESFVGGFAHPCHLWHSHEPISGGAIFDWGSHYIDWILQLFPAPVTAVTCVTHKRVWHDVSNADQVNLELRFADGTHATFIDSSVAAARKPKWFLLGSEGAVVADWRHATRRVVGPDGEIDEAPVPPTDLPSRVRILRPGPDGGASCQTLALPRRDRGAFYRDLAAHLRTGQPLAVTAEQARRTVAVMEVATRSAHAGGALIDTDI